MCGETSCSKSISLGSSSAQSHVYIQNPPLKFNLDESVNLCYDDGNRMLSSVTSNQVFSWRTYPFDSMVSYATDAIREGPVFSVRFSLDSKVLAIHRSDQEIEFLNRETGATSTERCINVSDTILGFFWTDCSICDIVFVKSSGLDMFIYNTDTGSLGLVETKKLDVSWFVYNHESRLVLLGYGMQCNRVNGYQLSSAGIVRLPKFEMKMAKSDVQSKPILNAEDIHIVTVYGMIYCLHIDRIAMQIHSYKFYRDGVVQQGSLPIYSNKVAVNVVDNVLILHQLDTKVAILYDLFADTFTPISAPLPLGLRLSSEEENNIETTIYADSWKFFPPDIICAVDERILWKIHIDLESISASCSEIVSIIEFLQRRKIEALKAKQLCLWMMRGVIVERRPVSAVAKAMDALVISFSHSVKMGTYRKVSGVEKSSPSGTSHVHNPMEVEESTVSSDRSNTTEPNTSSLKCNDCGPSQSPLAIRLTDKQGPPTILSPAISPEEMYNSIFISIEGEFMDNPSHLVDIILEFLVSASTEKVKVPPTMYVSIVRLLAQGGRFGKLGLCVMNKIIEPSKEVALQLVECGTRNSCRCTTKLGVEMLRRLCLHHDYITVLVKDGYYLDALRYAHKNKMKEGVEPSLFLGGAYASNDPQQLAAVIRFCCDFTPGFKNSPEFEVYYTIFQQMAPPPPIIPILD